MPQQDRTGPRGEGSKTGQGLGKCAPKQRNIDEMSEKEAKSFLKQILSVHENTGRRRRMRNGSEFESTHRGGSGRGFGRGFGRGLGRNYNEEHMAKVKQE